MPLHELKINGNGDEGILFKKIFSNIRTDKKVIINWAFAGTADGRIQNSIILNKEESRNKAKDKLGALQLLKDNNIPVVKFSENYSDLAFPVFGRRIKHKQGNDIKIYFHPTEVELSSFERDFYTEFCAAPKEYRVHIFNGRILIASRKYLMEGFEFMKGYYPFIKNKSTGYRFKTINFERYLPIKIKDACIKTATTMGLDWCAIDVLWTYDEEPKILEVNTTPGLTNKKLEIYSKAFLNKIKDQCTIVEGELDFSSLTNCECREEGLF